jgi:hypothetical protein
MTRRTRVRRHISARKKQARRSHAPPKESTVAELRGVFDDLTQQMMLTLSNAKVAQTLARTELIKTAQMLLPKARTLAERGRPRLLAVIAKIILDRHLQFAPNTQKLQEKIARMERELKAAGPVQ